MGKRHRALRGPRWERLRLHILERDGRECRECGKSGALFEVDHIIPLDHGGAPFDPGNLQTLCRACHIFKTAHDTGAFDPERERWRERLAVGT